MWIAIYCGLTVTLEHRESVLGVADNQKFGEANWDDQIAMYTICAIAPVFLVQALYVILLYLLNFLFPSPEFPVAPNG